jgi:hypothetical protein
VLGEYSSVAGGWLGPIHFPSLPHNATSNASFEAEHPIMISDVSHNMTSHMSSFSQSRSPYVDCALPPLKSSFARNSGGTLQDEVSRYSLSCRRNALETWCTSTPKILSGADSLDQCDRGNSLG